jgi:hypothetical protein
VLQATGFIKGPTNRWVELQEVTTANDRLIWHAGLVWPRLGPADDISGADRNPFFTRLGRRYANIAAAIGFGEDNPSRGLATADVDGDGRLDLVVANMWGPASFYRNESPAAGAFLGLRLQVPAQGGLTRPAIGASATVTRPDGTRIARQVDGGNGHSGRRSPDLHFGLGAATGPVTVNLKWRDALGAVREETRSLTPGWHTIVLGSPERIGS